jgi:RecA-family ATPase
LARTLRAPALDQSGAAILASAVAGGSVSIILLHLLAGAVLDREWLGATPQQGPALFIDCEDDQDVMHYRLAAIANHYDVCFTDLVKAGLHLTSLVGRDQLLATVSRRGLVDAPRPTVQQVLGRRV